MLILLVFLAPIILSSRFTLPDRELDCDTVLFEWSLPFDGFISGPVVYLEPNCAVSNVTNLIVISSWENDCRFSDKIKSTEQGGGLALIVTHPILAGAYARAIEPISHEEISIPLFSVQTSCIQSLITMSTNITGNITSTPNHWLRIYDHILFYFGQVLLGIWTTSLIILPILGIIYHYKQSLHITTKIVVLFFECLLNICSILVIMDIANSRGLFSYAFLSFMSKFGVCLIGVTNLLMAFFFLELFGDEMANAQESFLSVYRFHFIGFTIVCVLVSLIIGILGTEYKLRVVVYQSVAGLMIAVINLIAVFILLVVLWKCYVVTKSKGYMLKIRRVVFQFVIICILLTLMVIIPQFLYGTAVFYNYYGVRISLFYITVFFSNILSSYKIFKLAFVAAIEAIKSSSAFSKSRNIKQEVGSTQDNGNVIA